MRNGEAPQANGSAQEISLDYPVEPRPRYGYDQPAHPELQRLIADGTASYHRRLLQFLELKDDLLRIPTWDPENKSANWSNSWFAGLDALALYGFIAGERPRRYIEIGSGNSTLFARQAIEDHRTGTELISIDPQPRAEIDRLCDRVERSRLEDIDLSLFDDLESGDIVFFDGSHRCFTNSDATVAFLEVLPRLKPGVLVHFHDIFLPWDYPPQISDKFYSEQYLLAVQLLAGAESFVIELPNFFICLTPELHHLLDPVWDRFTWAALATNGLSFWVRRR